MNGIKQKVQAVLSGEETGGWFFLYFLHSISVIYGLVVGLRSFLYDKGIFKTRRLPCRVISIGNLTVGGTGKTPMTLYVAQLVKELGYRPVVISRGYKGLAEKKGGIVSDGETVFLDPDVAGDEPFMMARKLKGIPVLVGARRYQAGMRAVDKFSPDVIILDDAFQHRQLRRDTDLVLIDDKSYLGNEHLLPRGILREPVAGLLRADAFVLTRSGEKPTSARKRLETMVPGKPVFQSSHLPYILGVVKNGKIDLQDRFTEDISKHIEFLKKSTVFVFSGLAKNNEFKNMVNKKVKKIAGDIQFADHHAYTKNDFRMISDRAQKCSAAVLVTTEKDYVKIAGKMRSPMDMYVFGIRISFMDDEEKFAGFIKDRMT